MLAVILKILSILGIILLVLLGVILVVLVLILFYPVCYRIKAHKQPIVPGLKEELSAEEEPAHSIHADAKAWWLLGLLRVLYKYPEPGVLKVKLLFFTIYDSGQSEEESIESKKSSTKKEKNKKPESKDSKSEISKSEISNPAETANTDNKHEKNTDTSSKKGNTNPETITDSPTDQPENLTVIDKIQYTIRKFYDKIKGIFDKIKEICANIAYYKEILTADDTKDLLKHVLTRLGKVLKSIRPRKLRANIHYGAASPDTTGYACAIYGMLCPHLSKDIEFTPDFEQEILEGTIYAAGHTTVFKILWNAFLILKDKRLWELKEKLDKKPF